MKEEQPLLDPETLTPDVSAVNIPVFNHFEDAAFSLKMVAEWLPNVRYEEQYWKWVILSLHSCLQGFMVLALRLGNDFEIIQDGPLLKKLNCPHCGRKIIQMIKRSWGTRREWVAHSTYGYGEGTTHPKPRKLRPFLELYKRIKSPKYMERLYGSKSFKPIGRQGESVKWLNDALRNQFAHFLPTYWIDDASELLRIVDDCFQVVTFLVMESENIDWGRDTELESQVRRSIESIQQSVESLRVAFSTGAQENVVGSMDSREP